MHTPEISLNSASIAKIDNIRKSILYYNKLVKYESINKLAFADTNKFQKISPEQNTSIQGILKELITLTTTDNIYLETEQENKYKTYFMLTLKLALGSFWENAW